MTVVRVYTKPSCVQCNQTKSLLEREGIPFEVEDLMEEGNLNAAIDAGHAAAPVVVVGREEWSGFRPDKIMALAKRLKEGNK